MNFLGFQLGWLACVLTAANNQPVIGVVAAVIIVATHVYFMQDKVNTLISLFVISFLGIIWDSILTQQQILVFTSGLITNNLAPYWIMAMWFLFATTLNVSLRWLHGHYVYAMLLGAIAGPLAYQAGSALGAVIIPDSMQANIVLAAGWAVLMPLMMKTADLIDKHSNMRLAQ